MHARIDKNPTCLLLSNHNYHEYFTSKNYRGNSGKSRNNKIQNLVMKSTQSYYMKSFAAASSFNENGTKIPRSP